MATVRTRFAPSPTGFMHVGNLRTALYEYLVAKSQGGKFVLRIEDTDRERLVEGAEDVIYKTLEQVGLQHDEGPDVGESSAPTCRASGKISISPTPSSWWRRARPITASAPRSGWSPSTTSRAWGATTAIAGTCPPRRFSGCWTRHALCHPAEGAPHRLHHL